MPAPSTRIALLRGVNVGGANRIAMADLRGLTEGLGFTRARTLLQSGNVVFDAGPGADAAVEASLERALADRLGLVVDVVVRTGEAWRALIAANPLAEPARDDPAHLLLHVLKTAPDPQAESRLAAAIAGPEVARLVGQAAFIHYPAGIARSRLTNAVIDRAVGARGTARNWNTVLKLAAML